MFSRDWSSDVCSSDLITAGVGSHVKGGIKVHKPTSNWLPFVINNKRKPRIIVGPGAVVEGPLVFEREVTLYVHDSARIGPVTGRSEERRVGKGGRAAG